MKSFPDPGKKRLRLHLSQCILPGLVFYRMLTEDGYSRKEAIALLDKVLEKRYARHRSLMELIGKLPGSYFLMRALVPAFTHMECPKEGWETEWLENSRTAIRFNMHRCYYQDIYTKLGAPELVASFCKTDDFMYRDTSKKYEWGRTLTIGRGDDLCDFSFIRTIHHGAKRKGRQA